MPYEPVENTGSEYTVSCKGTSQIIGQLTSDAETWCKANKKTGTWAIYGAIGGCVGGIALGAILPVTIPATAPLLLTFCGVPAAAGGALANSYAMNCDTNKVSVQGACIASGGGLCDTLRPLNILGIKDSCLGGGLVAIIGIILLIFILNMFMKPPRR